MKAVSRPYSSLDAYAPIFFYDAACIQARNAFTVTCMIGTKSLAADNAEVSYLQSS